MSRSKRIASFNKADGKVHRPAASVDEVFGYEHSKFPTESRKEYEEILNEMNKYDLIQAAHALGLKGRDDRYFLQELMLKEFDKQLGALSASRAESPNLQIPKWGMDLLSEGA